MKRVSLEAAKAIAKAGYWCKYGHRCEVQEIVDSERLLLNVDYSLLLMGVPTYLDIWLWLWREKGIKIVAEPRQKVFVYIKADFYALPKELASVFDDPEDAIIAAIEYLVEHNLIK